MAVLYGGTLRFKVGFNEKDLPNDGKLPDSR